MAINYVDKAGLTYVISKIKALLDKKVGVVEGKGLSTNDYTNEDKNKLSNIASGAEVNVQSDWNVTDSSSDAFIKNKPTIPSVDSEMSDTSTNPVQNKVVKKAIADAIGSISTIKFEIVTELPATGNSYTIYLKAHSHGSGDAYDEYVYINNSWEKIGSTDIDLSGYVKTSDLNAISNTEIDSMFS